MEMKIGFVGLGIMGKPMCQNLIKEGYELSVSSSNPNTNKELEKNGATVCSSIAEVAKNSKIIILMLPNSPEVKETVLGENGLINHAKKGSSIVDMSSIAPNVSKEMYNELKKKDIHFMDAPVSGGEPKAIDGTISVMAGGDQQIYDECLPIIQAMAGSVTRVGEIGSGNATKLVNQIIVALNIASVSEAFVLAEKMGVDSELVYHAIRGGLAGSTVMDAKIPLILEGKFDPGFKINLHVKDLNNVIDTMNDVGLSLPLTSSITDVLIDMVDEGHGEEDHGAIIKHYEKEANVEVRKSH